MLKKLPKHKRPIQKDLELLNDQVKGLFGPTVTRLMYSIFIDIEASFELAFDEMFKKANTDLVYSFITAGLFQILGKNFLATKSALLNFNSKKKNPLTQEIINLSTSLGMLGGNDFLKEEKIFTGTAKFPNIKNNKFIANIRQLIAEKKLNLARQPAEITILVESQPGNREKKTG